MPRRAPKLTRQATETVVLTPAEARVLSLLPSHLTLDAIGARLGIARSTVKTHVARIYRKLDARTRAQAVEQAARAGLLTGDPDR